MGKYMHGWVDPRTMSPGELRRDYYWARWRRRVKGAGLILAFLLLNWVLGELVHAREPYSRRPQARASADAVAVATSDLAIEEGAVTAQGGSGGAGGDSALLIDIPRQAPPIGLALTYPTASCRGSITAGLSVPGGGAGVGLAPKDPQCDLRETARMLHNMGQTIVGYRLLCQTEAMGAVYNRPDHTSRREGRTVPDPEACLNDLMQYHGVTLEAFQDLQDSYSGLLEGVDDMRIQLIEQDERYQQQLARQAAEHEESLRRCQEELVSCVAK